MFDDKESRVRQQFSKIIGRFTFFLGTTILNRVEDLIFLKIKEDLNEELQEQSNLTKNYNDSSKKIESGMNTLLEILENLKKKGEALGERELKEIYGILEITSINQRKYIKISR